MASIISDIKSQAAIKQVKIQTSFESELERLFNSLFYLPKDAEKELMFLNQVMTRGTGTQERIGLHASAIIAGEKEFCYRQQVLSLIYKQSQGENINAGLKRIFAEGDAIHEKWQRLFIRGGLGKPEDMDRTRLNKMYELSYTPDAIITALGHKLVVEIKSVNTYQYKKMDEHASGKKQLRFYERASGVHEGITLCEDKNTQDFKIKYYCYDEEAEISIAPYIDRLEEIQVLKANLLKNGKIPKRHAECTSYKNAIEKKCNMADVCFGRCKEKLAKYADK